MLLAISVGDVRDAVIVVWGAIASLLTLGVLAVMVALLYFGRRGMRAVHRLKQQRLVPAIERSDRLARRAQEFTARLPGAPGATGGVRELVSSLRGARETVQKVEPPFRSRRRTWLPFR
jgi:hypothetical protein